jgi:beta-glucosidase
VEWHPWFQLLLPDLPPSPSGFGRFQEGFSPDPTITSHMGMAIVSGLQGGIGSPDAYLPNFTSTVAATAKHFAGYGQAAGGLNGGPNTMTNRTVFEIFLRPWRALAAVGVRGFMPSHETVLDVPVHANGWLINGVFRDEFGGGNATAVSDCNDIGALAYYGVGGWGVNNASLTQATALAVRAGVDLDLQCGTANTSFTYFSHLPDAIAAGYIDESQVGSE